MSVNKQEIKLGKHPRPTDAYEIYTTFNLEQRLFVYTKHFEGRYKLKKWVRMCRDLAIMDRHSDASREKVNKFRWISGATCVGLLIVAVALYFYFPDLWWLFLFPAVAFVPFLLILLRSFKLEEIDIPNSFRLFVVPLLIVLLEEAGKNTKCKIRLNLTNVIEPENIVKNNRKNYFQGETIYEHDWMHASLNLRDQVNLHWNIFDRVYVKHSEQENKHISYMKLNHIIHLTMTFPISHYKLKSEDIPEKWYESGDKLVIKLRGKSSSKSKISTHTPVIDDNKTIGVDDFLSVVAQGYSYVTPR